MGLQCGIVGLPNVGKSTLFNAITEMNIAAQNFPFCTIEPNVGRVTVPDLRLDQIEAIAHPQQVIPTHIELVDIAGLVKGASKGEGLGNQFLANIRETDAILQVVRCFANDDIIHVAGKVDPLHDIEVIETELLLADLSTVQKALQRIKKQLKSPEGECLTQLEQHLDAGKPARTFAVTEVTAPFLHNLHLLTAKPVLYVANVDEQGFVDNPLLAQVEQYAEKHGAKTVAICAALEAELIALPLEERQAFLQDLGLQEPGLHRLIRSAYSVLGLQTFFTVGPKELRAWTIKQGASAPEAAGCIHTDFQRGFIRAEVMHLADFLAHQGEAGVKEAGKYHSKGRDYIVQDGDIIHFRFNV